MHRFTPLPSSISLQTLTAHLSHDEQVVLHQDGVGLYDGKDKSPLHYDGRLYLTSHRLLFVSSSKPATASVSLELSLVRQTEYWTGFLKSSAKITLLLSEPSNVHPTLPVQTTADLNPSILNSASSISAEDNTSTSKTWVCRVCGMKNIASAQLGSKCSLCGIVRDPPSSRPASSSYAGQGPSSLPTSRASTPRLDRDGYSRTGTPPPLPPPPPKAAAVSTAPDPLLPSSALAKRIPCPVCTYLNHHSMSTCEVCESPLSHSRSSVSTPVRSSTPTIASSPSMSNLENGLAAAGNGATFVRLSFRKGGERAFYAALKDALAKKAWDVEPAVRSSISSSTNGAGDPTKARSSVGIDAVMRNMSLESASRDMSMEDALKDLNALMSKAKEMIKLAQEINERLKPSTAGNANDHEKDDAARLAQNSLKQIGLVDAAVTSDAHSDESKYHHELAKELAAVLQPPKSPARPSAESSGVMAKGLVGLDEVWCVWNRARGLALISPSKLRLCTPHLPLYTSPPITLRVFPSGLTILHTPRYSVRVFARRLLDFLDLRQALSASSGFDDMAENNGTENTVIPAIEREGATTLEIAREENIALILAKEMVEEVEAIRSVTVVRDEQGGEGVRWYRDFISSATWDGHVF